MLDERSMALARARLDALAKPLNSLGVFEEIIVRLAGIQRTPDVRLSKKSVLVFCADNGVVAEGVSQSPAWVTLRVAEKIADGRGSVSAMARACGADVRVVDVGMEQESGHPSMHNRRVAPGTGSIAQGPAMSREQAEAAIGVGVSMALELGGQGYDILATGEMGIGNTTTSSAIASVLLDLSVETVTGRGAGLSDGGLEAKRCVIERAIERNQSDASDPLDVLSKLGGFDIAAM